MASIDKLTAELLRNQRQDPAPKSHGYPSRENVNKFANTHSVTDISPDQSGVLNDMMKAMSNEAAGKFDSFSQTVMGGVESVFGKSNTGNNAQQMDAPIGTTLAAQAEVAALSALSSTSLLAPGLHVSKSLTATVYDKVKLTFQSSYLKNTLGCTTHTHQADVYIKAKDVRLTAPSMVVNTSNEERNTVTESKVIRRGANFGFGAYTTQYTAQSVTSITGLNVEPSAINNSAVVFRMAMLGAARNQAATRVGIKGINMEVKAWHIVKKGSPRKMHRLYLLRIIL